jgi:hypothetical protein
MQILKELDWEEVQLQLNRKLTNKGTKKNSLKQIDLGTDQASFTERPQQSLDADQGTLSKALNFLSVSAW